MDSYDTIKQLLKIVIESNKENAELFAEFKRAIATEKNEANELIKKYLDRFGNKEID
jgi:hypothetical protein